MKPFETKFTEANNIRFETLISEPVLTIPPQKIDARTSVEFGIRVINLSPNSYRFIFFYLRPEIVTADGKKVKTSGGINAHRSPLADDFVLLKPGDSVTSFINAQLFWSLEPFVPKEYAKQLVLQGRNKLGFVWSFLGLKRDTYLVRFPYENRSSTKKVDVSEDALKEKEVDLNEETIEEILVVG
ncbi:MAG: hypothetical protein SXA11_20440 [Cyanobacteriota bacterium]|nr:hypothetical protein [Cyanobacteriota bacterium]